MKINSDKIYRCIAIMSLIILVAVQFILIFNTFELRDNQFFLKEKAIIDNYYSKLIRNDKLFPGGQSYIDRHVMTNMQSLKQAYDISDTKFQALADRIWFQVLDDVRSNQNMDSIFAVIIQDFNLNPGLKYGLFIENLSVTFDGEKYIPIYSSKNDPQVDKSHPGALVAGNLKRAHASSRVSAINVSSPLAGSYLLSFSLHVDQDNRLLQIFISMLPMFTLTLVSILLATGILYFTYKNWMRQKKLAAMTSDFVNSITHEFNTPITTILVANKTLSNAFSTDSDLKLKDLTSVIDRQTNRLKKLINQSLMISQLTDVNLQRERVNLPSVLIEILADYSLGLDKGIEIIPNFQEHIPSVELNRFLFTTMVYNLLDNGIKYNASSFKQLDVELSYDQGLIYIRIKDNGIGMDKKSINYIFNKFVRLKNSIEENGLGIGLYYVQQVIGLHNWKLDVQSEPEVGSTFSIIIKPEIV